MDAIGIAAEYSVDVICQKPFRTDLASAREAVQIAQDAGIDLVIHENFRLQPWYRKIHELLNDRAIGEAYQVTFRLRPGDGQGADAYLDRQPDFQKMERFLVHETAIHLIDTFRFLCGEVTSVYEDLRQLNPAIAGEEAGIMLFEFANGTRGIFDVNRLADHQAQNRRLTMGELLLEGADGTIELDGDGTITLRRHGSNEAQEVGYNWCNHAFGGDCVFLPQRAIVTARRRGLAMENTGADYLRNLLIEEAVYQSDAEKRRILL